jgi:hypothetical protein
MTSRVFGLRAELARGQHGRVVPTPMWGTDWDARG